MPRDPEIGDYGEPEVTDKLLQKPDVITEENEMNRITTIAATAGGVNQPQIIPRQQEPNGVRSEECHDCTECHDDHCCFPFCYCICCGWCDELECCITSEERLDLDSPEDQPPNMDKPDTSAFTLTQHVIHSLSFFFRPSK